jgi:hypothetical protein
MKYYIVDSTLNDAPTLTFESVGQTIGYLKSMVHRKLNMTYEQYLTHLADLGHFGYDEREFYESLRDTFNSGVVRGNQLLRCSIYEATTTNKDGSD